MQRGLICSLLWQDISEFASRAKRSTVAKAGRECQSNLRLSGLRAPSQVTRSMAHPLIDEGVGYRKSVEVEVEVEVEPDGHGLSAAGGDKHVRTEFSLGDSTGS